MIERHSVQVLRECIDLQNKKANDYQNPNSTIKQADYYPSGCLTILEIIHAKVLRMCSVMEAMQHDPSYKPNFESLEDSAKDLINYASFYVAYSRGKVDGQEADRDFLNRKVDTTKNVSTTILVNNINEMWNDWNSLGKGGFIGETGDSGRDERNQPFVGHPGVTADLKEYGAVGSNDTLWYGVDGANGDSGPGMMR
jgi:hypothetical protein